MNLNPEETQFLVTLADGRRKAWGDIARDMGMIMTPNSFLKIKTIGSRLKKLGLVERRVILTPKYRITSAGIEALDGLGF